MYAMCSMSRHYIKCIFLDSQDGFLLQTDGMLSFSLQQFRVDVWTGASQNGSSVKEQNKYGIFLVCFLSQGLYKTCRYMPHIVSHRPLRIISMSCISTCSIGQKQLVKMCKNSIFYNLCDGFQCTLIFNA